MVNIFVESYLFEPANLFCTSTTTMTCELNNIYVHKSPITLHPYNNGFERGDPNITINMVDCCFDLGVCCGPGTGTHVFLLAECFVYCKVCCNKVCNTCTLAEKTKKTMR